MPAAVETMSSSRVFALASATTLNRWPLRGKHRSDAGGGGHGLACERYAPGSATGPDPAVMPFKKGDYLFGSAVIVAGFYLFVMLFRVKKFKVELPAPSVAFRERLMTLPFIQKAMKHEGLVRQYRDRSTADRGCRPVC